MATQIGISLYEGLTTDKYRAVDGTVKVFPFVEFAERCAEEFKINRQRFFTDLNFFWYNGAPRFRPEWAILPYAYVPPSGSKPYTFRFNGPLNPLFVERIEELVRIGRKNGVQYLPCFATAEHAPNKSTFFIKMGYASDNEYYYRAESPQNIASGAWARLQKYYHELSDLLAPFPVRFPIVELYNEQEYGSWVDEYQGLKPVQKLQMNGDTLFPDEITPGAITFFRRMMNGISGIKIFSFSFHGVFTSMDVTNLARSADMLGIPRARLHLSTDGATPMYKNGRWVFTRENHNGHYRQRINFTKPGFTQQFIDAAVKIRDEAIRQRIGIMDFQSPLKFQENLEFTPQAVRYYKNVMGV